MSKQEQPRRSSFGMLLRRSKSGELKGKKAQALKEAELQRQRNAIPKSPPRLPVLYNGASSGNEYFQNSFDGDRPDSIAIVSGRVSTSNRPSMDPGRSVVNIPAVPPIPKEPYLDPYARTESMTHRGRYSYASSAITNTTLNSPRRVRRRKDPTPLNILIIGCRSAGKTSFLEFLKTSLALPNKRRGKHGNIEKEEGGGPLPAQGNFVPHYLETEIDNERIGLTLWDSEGLEKNVVDLQLREMSQFLESKFEETFEEEQKVIRSPGVQDTHIHAVFLILDPARLDRNIAAARGASMNGNGNGNHALHPRVTGGLDEDLDLQVLRTLQGKTTVIPVISKADTITTKHMNVLKKTVWDSLKQANLDPLVALGLDEQGEQGDSPDNSRIDEVDEEDEDAAVHSDDDDSPGEDWPIQRPTSPGSPASKKSNRESVSSVRRLQMQSPTLKEDEVPYIPMSIISPDIYEPGVVGRQFPWGFADPNDETHCDFLRLKDAVFSEWRGELREASREQWYENWRTSRLKTRDGPKGSVRR